MAPNFGGAVSKPDVETSRLVEALDQKRKQLDLEIAEFKTRKDEEYRVFEKKLRGTGDEKDTRNEAERTGKSSQERGRLQTRGSSQSAGAQDNGWTSKLRDGFGDDSVHDHSQSSHILNAPNGQKDPVVGSFLNEHEREKEFRGLFTPSYLPLLETTSQGQQRDSGEGVPSPLLMPQDSSTSSRNAAQGFSSSATLPTPSFNISPPPPAARPLAASVPHRQELRERRDSSIASLRSSMRDPKTPRSPKRVLFSIDDVVVSPSTSPIAKRLNEGISSKTMRPFDMPTAFTRSSSMRNGKYEGYHVMDWTRSLPINSGTFGSNSNSPFSIPSGRPLGSTATSQPRQASNDSPLTAGEEFEHVNSEDELFAFDEDLQMEDLEDEEENPEGDIRSDDEEDSKDAIPESSPHAGSLPIEIRWPVRSASES